ncbi:MAG TPA: uracil-DNA glycosylase [Pyrinomonadaceae bacterium]|nr:uracil-DNA glycosylase [Pyrinomonadaceae bacterium]
MSEDTRSELTEILHNLREHAKFFGELGIENLSLEAASEPAHQAPPPETLAASTTGRVSTFTPAPVTSISEKTDVRPRPQPEPSLFNESAASSLPRSNETLEQIWADIGDCTRCGLCEGRTQVVNTHGNRKARLMFVGEAPGADEDAQGKPFVGRAGQLLTKMIEAMGMKREEVIIGNVNRCRPPGNRQPTLEEAAICRPFLFREIAAIQPDIIVVMGNTALRNLLEAREGITRVRGKFQDFRGIKVMPTFHPAYLLRDPSKKRETWEDLKMVMEYLENHPPKSHT